MTLFGRNSNQAILDSIENLAKEVAELRGEKEALRDVNALTRERRGLREEIETLRIERDRQEETHKRETREVEHLVGLQKKRADQERELAVKEAKLEVREGNLTAKEEAFEERLEVITRELKAQVEYLRTDIVKELLARLPIFNVDTALEPHRMLTAGSNGHGKEEKD